MLKITTNMHKKTLWLYFDKRFLYFLLDSQQIHFMSGNSDRIYWEFYG